MCIRDRSWPLPGQSCPRWEEVRMYEHEPQPSPPGEIPHQGQSVDAVSYTHLKGEIHSMDRHSTLSHQQAAADYEMIQDAFLYYFGRKEGEQHERVD